MGGNIKKLKFLREAVCILLAFILCLRQTVHEKVISPVAPFTFGKNKSRRVTMNVVIVEKVPKIVI